MIKPYSHLSLLALCDIASFAISLLPFLPSYLRIIGLFLFILFLYFLLKELFILLTEEKDH